MCTGRVKRRCDAELHYAPLTSKLGFEKFMTDGGRQAVLDPKSSIQTDWDRDEFEHRLRLAVRNGSAL